MTFIESINPVTKEKIASFDSATPSQIDTIFDSAHEGFKSWKQVSFDERLLYLKNYTKLLEKNKKDLAILISQETGKALWDSETEVSAAVGKLSHSVSAYKTLTPEQMVRPIGVMSVLGPYNFPLHLPNGHIIPALLAGNTVIFKPSEKASAVGSLLVKLLHQAGVPKNAIQIIYGKGDIGEALVKHSKVNGVLFTGGERTGLSIHRHLAGRPEVMLALELGGNNPLIVWSPDDVRAAAETVIYSAFISGGQRCSCARRLIIPESSKDVLIDDIISVAKTIKINTPFSTPQPFYSSLIDAQAVKDAYEATHKMISSGCGVVFQGQQTNGGDSFMAPIILDVTGVNSPDEEIFAPILQVIRVADFDEAIIQANNTRFGLAAGLISSDKNLWNKFNLTIKAGIINLNSPTVGATGNAPFGGVGRSGNFRPAGYYSAYYSSYPVAHVIKDTTDKWIQNFDNRQ